MLTVADVVNSVVVDARDGLRMRAFSEDVVPDPIDGAIVKWKVLLTFDGQTMRTTLYGAEPTLNGVLSAIASDAAMTPAGAADVFGDDGVGLMLWGRTIASVERVFGSVGAFLSRVEAMAGA